MNVGDKKEQFTNVPDLDKFLTSEEIVNIVKGKSQEIELEIRFGICNSDNSFTPNVGKESYKNIIKTAKKTFSKTAGPFFEKSFVCINTNSSSKLRKIIYLDKNNEVQKSEYIRKERLSNYTNTHYNMRFSISHEKIMEENFVPSPKDKNINLIRYRDRQMFLINKDWRLDITKTAMLSSFNIEEIKEWSKNVKENKIENPEETYNYEIELEYVGKVKSYQDILPNMKDAINFIFDIIYSKKGITIVNKQIFYDIIRKIKNTIKERRIFQLHRKPIKEITIRDFGNNVITLERYNLQKIRTENYCVTEKTDGERAVIYGNNRNIYMIDSVNNMYKFSLKSTKISGDFLLDGEYLEFPDKKNENYIHRYFLIFDIMINKSSDITHMKFEKRQEIISEILESIKFSEKEKIKVFQKKFEYFNSKNFTEKNKYVLSLKRDYDIDGLIYTSVLGDYFEKIYKWKPPEQNTIDFLIKLADPENDNKTFLLFVMISRGLFKKMNLKIEKWYKYLFPEYDFNLDNYFPILFEPDLIQTTEETKDLNFSETTISPKKQERLEIEDNSIVEFSWDPERKKWSAYRKRDDKIYANNWKTAMSSYRNILFPLTTEMMTGKEKIPDSYFQSQNSHLLDGLKKFHSHIKKELYNEYTNENENILELGGGRSNDYHKWKYNKIKNIVLIDNDPIAIQEGMKRTENETSFKVRYINDTMNQNLPKLLKKNSVIVTKFDSIVANFSIHYILDNEKSINLLYKNIRHLLNKDGYFILTTFDGKKVFADLQKTNPIILENDKGIELFRITPQFKISVANTKDGQDKLAKYGQKISVYVESIGKEHEEYLVNIQYLIHKFISEKEFELVENTSFGEILDRYSHRKKLSDAEKIFSTYSNIVVFRKIT